MIFFLMDLFKYQALYSIDKAISRESDWAKEGKTKQYKVARVTGHEHRSWK